MALNQVQVKFVGEVIRPMIEELILFKSKLDAFVLDFDNQQTPLPTNATVLDDNDAGTSPRTDAPQLTGTQSANLRTFCANMSSQITPTQLAALVNASARPVEHILRRSR
jgi:DNA gyrase/topoisomerase IV subunit B